MTRGAEVVKAYVPSCKADVWEPTVTFTVVPLGIVNEPLALSKRSSLRTAGFGAFRVKSVLAKLGPEKDVVTVTVVTLAPEMVKAGKPTI
jgi:hypothetical protein